MPKANSIKEVTERSTRVGRPWIAPFPLLKLEALEKGPKPMAEWKLSELRSLLSLGLKPYHVTVKINKRKRNPRLRKPASLPVANPVSDTHPFGLPVETAGDQAMLREANRRLLTGLFALQTQLCAGVTDGKTALNRLLHDYSQDLNLIYGGVSASKPAARTIPKGSSPIAGAPPLHEVSDNLPAHLPGNADPSLPEVKTDVLPALPIAPERKRRFTVTLKQEPPNPSMPHFWSTRTSLAFFPCEFVPQPSRFSRFMGIIKAQFRAALDALARFVSKLDPPVRGVDSLVEGRHNVGKDRERAEQ